MKPRICQNIMNGLWNRKLNPDPDIFVKLLRRKKSWKSLRIYEGTVKGSDKILRELLGLSKQFQPFVFEENSYIK